MYSWLASLVWDSESLGKPSFSLEESRWHHRLSCCHEVGVWLLQFSQTSSVLTRLAGTTACYLLCRDPEHAVHSCSPCLENHIDRAATECSSAHRADRSDRVHLQCILHVFVPVQRWCHYRSNLVVLGADHGCYNTGTQHGFNSVKVDKDRLFIGWWHIPAPNRYLVVGMTRSDEKINTAAYASHFSMRNFISSAACTHSEDWHSAAQWLGTTPVKRPYSVVRGIKID